MGWYRSGCAVWVLGIGLFAVGVVDAVCAASLRITVNAGERQTFTGGVGASSQAGPSYDDIPQDLRQKAQHMFWVEGNFHNLRLWVRCNQSAEETYNRYKLFVEDALAARKDILIYLGPDNPHLCGGAQAAAQSIVEQVAYLCDKGWPVKGTGMVNEPSVDGKASPGDIVSMLKLVRSGLDGKGLSDVMCVAPEVPGTDQAAFNYTNAIIGDGAALKALGAFSTHSYTMCMTKQLANLEAPHGKEHWITESSDNGPEEQGNDQVAARCAACVTSDVNLGVHLWTHFLSIEAYDPEDNKTRIIGPHPDTKEVGELLKYYYYKQFNYTIMPGSVMRQCQSSEGSHQWMENNYGEQPAICATAAVNPDDSWGLVAVNKTGTEYTKWGHFSQDAQAFDVTFHVEELAGAGDIDFNVLRSNKSEQLKDEGVKTMSGGDVTVHLEPREIVSLRSGDFSIVGTVRPSRASMLRRPSIRTSMAGSGIRFNFEPGAARSSKPVEARVYDFAGAVVAVLPVDRNAEGLQAELPRGSVSAGAYVLRVRAGGTVNSLRFVQP